LERIITDGTWRCPNRDVAAKWAESGGKVWLGEFVAGTTYPTNKDGEYCTKAGRVCHEVSSSLISSLSGPADQVQDDVIPTFGGGSSVSLPSEREVSECQPADILARAIQSSICGYHSLPTSTQGEIGNGSPTAGTVSSRHLVVMGR
jgi:hypothetical protein